VLPVCFYIKLNCNLFGYRILPLFDIKYDLFNGNFKVKAQKKNVLLRGRHSVFVVLVLQTRNIANLRLAVHVLLR